MDTNKTLTAFTDMFQGYYIAGYQYNNKYRRIRLYIRHAHKHGGYTFTLDYTHARRFTAAAANKHADAIQNKIECGDIKS